MMIMIASRGTNLRKLLIAAFLVVFSSMCPADAAHTIAKGGAAQAVIVVDAAASSPQKFASGELRDFLKHVTGGDFAIVDKRDPSKCNLLVGPAAAKMVDASFSVDGLGSDGIVVRTVGNDIILAGGETRGTIYAVYAFLQDQVGCYWWTPSASTIPSKPTLEVGELNVRFVPPLEYRETDCPGALEGTWSVRNHYNGSYHQIDGVRGGKIGFIAQDKWSCHTFWTLLPPEIYFKDHPEWYSLINGKRQHTPHEHSGLCLANEDARKELVKNQKLALAWHPNANMVSISQIDDAGPPDHCQCDKCAAVEKEEGSYAGNTLRFVNKCAEELEKDFPNLIIDTLAYHYTQKPPKITKPRANVAVRLCDIHCSFSVPLSHDRNRVFRDDLVGWSKICKRLYIWDYVGNFGRPLLPNPNLRVLGPNARFLIKNGAKGLFAEAPVVPFEAMSALRSWFLGQIYWNPDQDERKLIDTFCSGYFGAGGKEVVAYLDTIHDAVEASGDFLGLDSPADAKFLSYATLSKGWSHLLAAEEAAAGNAEVIQRIRREQIPVLYAVVMNWQRCREQAKSESWPWTTTQAGMLADLRARAAEQGIDLSGVPLPAATDAK
jgi:hypothetical protein